MTRGELSPLASLLALRVAATVVAIAAGFFAVSDDDFARVVIAQSFAEDPRFDPSGSSWLPFPFWLNGSAMLVLGRHFWVARLISIVVSLTSVAVVYGCARHLGLRREQAWLAAAGAAVLPHSVWLGYATVPELLSASACLVAVVTTTEASLRMRTVGAALILCATLSRYESWAVALVVGALNVFDAVRHKRASLLVPAALCALGPLAWLVHGALNHGDATFFVRRVVDYKRMLGRGSENLVTSLVHAPKLVLTGEPELTLASAGALLLAGAPPARLLRLVWASGALLAFLVYGDVRDGAPTHHPERPLLMLWLVLCVLLGWALPTVWQHRRRWLVVPALCAVFGLWVRVAFSDHDAFVDRRVELALGRQLRDELPASARLSIDLGDYSYFAVIAGFGSPARAHGMATIDPRQAQLRAASPVSRLARLAREHGSTHVVVRTGSVAPEALGRIELESRGLSVIRLKSGAGGPSSL